MKPVDVKLLRHPVRISDKEDFSSHWLIIIYLLYEYIDLLVLFEPPRKFIQLEPSLPSHLLTLHYLFQAFYLIAGNYPFEPYRHYHTETFHCQESYSKEKSGALSLHYNNNLARQ